MQAYNNRPNN